MKRGTPLLKVVKLSVPCSIQKLKELSGRWGEVEIEKGPVELFPTEPTDEAIYGEETLNPGFKGLLG